MPRLWNISLPAEDGDLSVHEAAEQIEPGHYVMVPVAQWAAAEKVVEALIQLHGTDCYIENEYGHSCDQFRAIMAAANAADLNSAKQEGE